MKEKEEMNVYESPQVEIIEVEIERFCQVAIGRL